MRANNSIRLAALVAGAALITAVAAQPAVAAPATAPKSEPIPAFDYRDCPQIPAWADRTRWRCEVMIGTGQFTIGGRTQPIGPMKTTHAEGPGPDGGRSQFIFGKLHADPVALPGGLLGIPGSDAVPALRLSSEPQYAGFFDFPPSPVRKEVLHLKFAVHNPLVGRNCTIGDNSDPVRLEATQTGGIEVVSQDPQIVKFTVQDQNFAVPAARRCGAFTELVNHRYGLPSAAGKNKLSFSVYFTMKAYDKL